MNTADISPREIEENSIKFLQARFEGASAAYWGLDKNDNPYNKNEEVTQARMWEYGRATYVAPVTAMDVKIDAIAENA